MIGALSQYGRLGLTAIGNSPEQAEAIYAHALEVLDRETAPVRARPIGPGLS